MRAVAAATAALSIAAVLAGCATSTAGKGTHGALPVPRSSSVSSSRGLPQPSPSVAPPTAPSSPGPSSPAPSASLPPSAPSSGVPADVAKVLLTAAEIGHGFVETGTDTTSSEPYPCTPSAPPVDTAEPPTKTGTVEFSKSSVQLGITEQVSMYADLTHAQHAEGLVEAGLACSRGTLPGGQSVKITGPTDISTDLTAHVDGAQAWSIQAGATVGALVQVRIKAVLVHFAFIAANKKHPGAIDVKQILETGIAKVINGG